MRPVPVHFFGADGLIACKGLTLEASARPADRHPPKLTIRLDLVTCAACRASALRGAVS